MIDQPLPLAIDSAVDVLYDASVAQPAPITLRQNVQAFVRQQLQALFPENRPVVTDFYDFVLVEIEAPLLEMVLQYTGQNQSKAARLLALSRGTLRKKMRRYGLLSIKEK